MDWRLIIDGPTTGERNMAIDRAIQLAVADGAAPPTLRLYEWERPTASIGRFQSPDSVDLAYCERFGVDVARRFTGGRGVLHDNELTYGIIAGTQHGVPRGVAASYRYLCAALVDAYQRLGVAASLMTHDAQPHGSGACYLQGTRADLSLGAMKLSGSAQVWHGDTVLQHGSFVVSRDAAREARVFRLDGEGARRLQADTATLESALGEAPAHRVVREAVIAAVSEHLGVVLVTSTLTDAEEQLLESLLPQVRVDVRP